jgi:hypothetical protein
MPWSPVDANLGLFEVFGFNDVAAYGGILPLLQLFFVWALLQKLLAD